MTERGYRVRGGEAADVPAVLGLMRESLGEGNVPRTEAYWRWKHEENPFGTSPFHVAENERGIVGVRVFMRWTWLSGATRVEAVRAVDTATHPAFQGRGIFRELTLGLVKEMLAQGIAFVFNTPNEKSRPGYLKMGWNAVGRLSLWVRPQRPLRLISALRSGVGEREPFDEAAVSPIDVPVSLLPSLDFARLVGINVDERRLHTQAGAAFLDWRYARCPAARYRFASVDPRGALVVYRVRQRRDLRELTVCDVYAERSARGAITAATTLRRLATWTAADHALAALQPGAFQGAVMAAAGFVPAPRTGPVLTTRVLTMGTHPDPRIRRSWGASVGDMELF